jgi:hypothetical protein
MSTTLTQAKSKRIESACLTVMESGIAITGCGGAALLWSNDGVVVECDPLGALVLARGLEHENMLRGACRFLECPGIWLVRFLYGFHQERVVRIMEFGPDNIIEGWKPDKPSAAGYALAKKLKLPSSVF